MAQTGASGSNRRIILDVSSISRWLGPPVGIMRREHALARYALSRRPEIQFSFFDKPTSTFLAIEPAWIERLIGWDHGIDMATPDVRRGRKGMARLKPSRYLLTKALERRRLTTDRPAIRRAIDLGQWLAWLPRGLPAPFTDRYGSRLGVIPRDLALGPPYVPGPNDVVVSVGNDWLDKDATAIARLKQCCGFRYVVMCHDLIPVMFPAFFPEHFAALFRRHWAVMFPIADRVLVNSRRVEADIGNFCRKAGIGVGDIALVQPGCDLVPTDPAAALPMDLEPGRFALFVGTIEPRKGHAMLLDVWRLLVAKGIPQRRGFKLVLAGRPGWNVEDVLHQIADAESFEGTLLHLSGVDDRSLAGLYHAAAFCLLPSVYEGFGVPIIEAFAQGKAVIASDGGALPETVGSLSPCLPATDMQAWLTTIQRWIEDDDARAPYEAKIRASFPHPNWEQAAARIFEAVERDA
jgi:glycosyltransferase involved in cell wall biosynthesis